VKVVYITGVTGFLGSHLARALVRHGVEVHGLKRSSSDLSRLRDVARQLTFHDVDRGGIETLFSGQRPPDAIVHLATNYGRQGDSPSELARANTLFPLTLLEAAVRRGVATFLNADTCYTTEYKHLQAYTLSKKQLVDWGRILATRQTRFINLKLFHPYGPGDGPTKFVPEMVRRCLELTGEIQLTAGEQRKDFVYVDDVVSAMGLLLRNPERLDGGFVSLDCGSGQAVPIREFVETVHRVTKSRTRLRFGALPYRDNEMMFAQADVSLLISLGWRPVVSLEQGIGKILREEFGRD
jgi:nucleoside-diphosphate-sugar epimerase